MKMIIIAVFFMCAVLLTACSIQPIPSAPTEASPTATTSVLPTESVPETTEMTVQIQTEPPEITLPEPQDEDSVLRPPSGSCGMFARIRYTYQTPTRVSVPTAGEIRLILRWFTLTVRK